MTSGLVRWFGAHRPAMEDLTVGPITRPAIGFSSETIFTEIAFVRDGVAHAERIVLRLPPASEGVFPEYDLVKQARLQAVLADTEVPVPRPIGVETDESWIGTPFLVMPRVNGAILSNNPSFLRGSWLQERSLADQAAVHANFVDTLAAIHRLDWNGLGLGFLSERPGLTGELDRWESYLTWAAEGSPPQEVVDAYAWCRANPPEPEPPPSLVWGDPGFSNVLIGDSLSPAAVLDWELASLAPAEMDLAWFLAFHEDAELQAGAVMPGFPGREATIARYEEQLGRTLVDFRWFEVFAVARGASCLVRIQRLLLARDLASTEDVAQHPGFGEKLRGLMTGAHG